MITLSSALRPSLPGTSSGDRRREQSSNGDVHPGAHCISPTAAVIRAKVIGANRIQQHHMRTHMYMTCKNCGVASKAVERGRARNMIELQKSRRESDTHEITCSPKSRALALATETATERTIYSTRSATASRSRIAKASSRLLKKSRAGFLVFIVVA